MSRTVVLSHHKKGETDTFVTGIVVPLRRGAPKTVSGHHRPRFVTVTFRDTSSPPHPQENFLKCGGEAGQLHTRLFEKGHAGKTKKRSGVLILASVLGDFATGVLSKT